MLHESEESITNHYGTVQIPFELFDTIDTTRISGHKKEMFGYACVTNDKEYFARKYPELKVKPATIDDLIILLGGPEE